MSEETRTRIADICAGILALTVAFLVKPPGWSIQHILIWLAVLAPVYIVAQLLMILPRIVKSVRERKEE